MGRSGRQRGKSTVAVATGKRAGWDWAAGPVRQVRQIKIALDDGLPASGFHMGARRPMASITRRGSVQGRMQRDGRGRDTARGLEGNSGGSGQAASHPCSASFLPVRGRQEPPEQQLRKTYIKERSGYQRPVCFRRIQASSHFAFSFFLSLACQSISTQTWARHRRRCLT